MGGIMKKLQEAAREARRTAVGVLIGLVLASPLYVFATTWTPQKTWVANEVPTAAMFNTYIRDNGTHLKEEVDTAVKRLYSDTTDRANSGATATSLAAYALDAGKLSADNQAVRVTAMGVFAANANTKQVTLLFGATVCATSSASTTYNAIAWKLEAIIVRKSATLQRGGGTFISPDGAATALNATYCAPAETLSGSITVQTQGDGDASNDITNTWFVVEYLPGS